VEALRNSIAVPGYASIIVAVLVLGGLQLLALGVLGEYIGRLHLNVNRKPQYKIRQVIAGNSQGSSQVGVGGEGSRKEVETLF
jgi:undecaprenyl-phosphate 4-deoxy-4-formamido-L-arabinose transferase